VLWPGAKQTVGCDMHCSNGMYTRQVSGTMTGCDNIKCAVVPTLFVLYNIHVYVPDDVDWMYAVVVRYTNMAYANSV
jgi:hypothetical protein